MQRSVINQSLLYKTLSLGRVLLSSLLWFGMSINKMKNVGDLWTYDAIIDVLESYKVISFHL